MLKLYKWYSDWGRIGSVEGLFVATDGEIEKLNGRTIHFGEILGKHSEVSIEFETSDFVVKSDDQVFINKLVEVMETTSISGYDPLDYLYEDDDCEDKDEE